MCQLAGDPRRAAVIMLFLAVTAASCSRNPAAGMAAAQPGGRSMLLDSLARANAHVVTVGDGRLGGAGAELIRQAATGTDFVTLGENHNTRAIPEFTVALFRMLHDEFGYNFVALEEGPALGALLSRQARSGEPDGAFRLGVRYPGAFHMYTDEELRMMDRLATISTDPHEPLWGLNQEFGLTHVLARLVELAPNAAARSEAESQLERARRHEAPRRDGERYIVHVAGAADFERLRSAFSGAGSEAQHLIGQAALSHEIYAPYAVKPEPHFTVFHRSGRQREENMKTLFTERYRAAQARGMERPKVLVKSGHVHLNRGLGAFNETWTLGNFLSEVATFQGSGSLHLYVLVRWPDLEDSFFAPFMPHVPRGENIVFDLRPMRAHAAHNAFRGLDPELRRVLVGCDLLVILDDRTRGTQNDLRAAGSRSR